MAAITKFAAARFVEILAQLSLVLLSRGRCKSRSTMVAAVVGRDTSAIAATRSVDRRVRVRTRLDPTSFNFRLKVVVGRDTGRHI